MFGSAILEVAIGLIFVFLLVSVICAAVREGIESRLKSRAAFLEQGIRELLHDQQAVGLARSFYTHPLIYSLFAGRYEPGSDAKRPDALARGRGLPSYIPSRNFALALMDIAARGPGNSPGGANASSPVLSLDAVRANVVNLENAHVQRVLLTAIDTARGDLDRAVANLAAWYDSGMDRVSGAYKRATQNVLFVIGLVVAIALNVNTITIADYLYRNDAARAAIVARAEAAARDSSLLHGDTTRYRAARAELDSLRLPIGWSAGWGAPRQQPDHDAQGIWNNALAPIIGWLLTALAVTLGAPFWFDVLNKLMVIRSTVKPSEKSPDESSEDRQSDAGRQQIAAQRVGAQAPPVGAGIGDGAGAPLVTQHATPQVTQSATQPTSTAIPGPRLPAPLPGDEGESDFDGCSVMAETLTEDEDLPQAHGGVV